jgi:hypothetical protein
METLGEHASGTRRHVDENRISPARRFGIAGNWHLPGRLRLSLSAMGVLGYDVFEPGDRVAMSAGLGIGFANGSGDNVAGARVGVQWTR